MNRINYIEYIAMQKMEKLFIKLGILILPIMTTSKLETIGHNIARKYAKDKLEEQELFCEFMYAAYQESINERRAIVAGKNEILDCVRSRNRRFRRELALDQIDREADDLLANVELKITFDCLYDKLSQKDGEILNKVRRGEDHQEIGVSRMFLTRWRKRLRGLLDD